MRGNPDAAELAALTVVLTRLTAATEAEPDDRRPPAGPRWPSDDRAPAGAGAWATAAPPSWRDAA
ncbi:acyl-CoA carboxylase epsilon subunit [Streptomyces sp. NPDC047028]|uniref:acyl-CoA carboxylase epsilon subunit n=1 Tax=Streptomyces sp. NPDC047028 TaxID=3155793 RepID=UPI003402DE19